MYREKRVVRLSCVVNVNGNRDENRTRKNGKKTLNRMNEHRSSRTEYFIWELRILIKIVKYIRW